MTVRAIVAVSLNGVIGVDSDLPWHLKDDLQLFKRLTTGRVVVMGRKTFESIGKPLPNRVNIVLSRSMPNTDGVRIVRSLEELMPILGGEVDVIGGSEIYKLMLEHSLIDQLIVTHVSCVVDYNKPSKLYRFDFASLAMFRPIEMIYNKEADKDNDFDFKTFTYIRG